MSTPEVDPHFFGLIMNLQSSAWIHLGKVANPSSGKVEQQLEGAKEIIDLMSVLETKTKGNLTPDEEKLFVGMLTELRLNYVDELKRSQAAEKQPDAADKQPDAAASPGSEKSTESS